MGPDPNRRSTSASCDPEPGISSTAADCYYDAYEYCYTLPIDFGIFLKPKPVPPAERWWEPNKNQVIMSVQFNRRQMFSKSGFLPNRVRRRFRARKNFADNGV